LKEGGERGLINALSNSKRAIDCQIDEVLTIFGIEHDKLPNELEKFIKYFDFEDNLPFKLKVIQGLNLAPGYIMSKVRTLRNRLEHYYKIPDKESGKEAIDVAELFIRSIEGKLIFIEKAFDLVDIKSKYIDDYTIHFDRGLRLSFFNEKKEFCVSVMNEPEKPYSFQLNVEDLEYFDFLRLMFSIDDEHECEESVKCIFSLLGHPMPINKLKLTIK